MKQSPSTSEELQVVKRLSVDIASRNKEAYSSTSFSESSENESSTDKLLKRICDLLETRLSVQTEEGQRYEADRENEMKNDWMLAAAVLDRICAIVVTVIFVDLYCVRHAPILTYFVSRVRE